jgi:hypothetical protein
MATHVMESSAGTLHLTGPNGWTHGVSGTVLGTIDEVGAIDESRLCGSCTRHEAGLTARLLSATHRPRNNWPAERSLIEKLAAWGADAEAFTRIAEGYERALEVDGITQNARGMFERSLVRCERIAGGRGSDA